MWKYRKDIYIQNIGIECQQGQLQCCFLDNAQQPVSISLPLQSDIHSIKQRLGELINVKQLRLRLVCALSAHHIWYKNQYFPHPLSKQECDQQCRFLMENELPIEQTELWFDYCYNSLTEGSCLELFAVRKSIAQTVLAQYAPLNINVLDHIAYALWRAFEFIQPQHNQETIFFYQNEELTLALAQQNDQLRWLQKNTQPDENVLLSISEEFCQRYQYSARDYWLYSTYPNLCPEEWQQLHTQLPLIALGCALWKRELG